MTTNTLTKQAIKDLLNPTSFLVSLLILLNLISAITVIFVKNQYRNLFIELQQIKAQEQKLNTQHSQLLLEYSTWKSQDRVTLIAEYSNGTELQIQSAGKCTIPINLSIYGEHGYKNILIQDTFYAFKKSLIKFEQCILTEESDTKPDELIRNIALLELGMK